MSNENELLKYVHIERFGTDEVDGINVGTCHVFPKIDGTNASIWNHSELGIACGSRNRFLAPGAEDNGGFREWATAQDNLRAIVAKYPDARFFGEWLIPHSLKTYRDEAWRKFYVFDAVDSTGRFLHFDEYSAMCKEFSVDFIPCMAQLVNPTYETLFTCTERNTFLINDNQGVGEGIVIKQYGYQNRFGRCTWAKIVTNSFKDKNAETFGPVEAEIASEFLGRHEVDKIVAKIRTEHGQFGSKNIPQLLGMAFHDLVTENTWQALKKHKNPKIDFKTLQFCAINRVKELLPELFGKAA